MKTPMTAIATALLALGLAGCNDNRPADAEDQIGDTRGEEVGDVGGTLAGAAPAEPAIDGRLPAAGAEATDGRLDVSTEGQPGAYLTDSAGSSLYTLEDDSDGSGCVDACLDAWPPLLVGDVAPSGSERMQAGMVGTIERADGSSQVTYNGHPLYRYAADTGTGRTAGHGVEDQWGHWYLVTPEGERMEAGAQ